MENFSWHFVSFLCGFAFAMWVVHFFLKCWIVVENEKNKEGEE